MHKQKYNRDNTLISFTLSKSFFFLFAIMTCITAVNNFFFCRSKLWKTKKTFCYFDLEDGETGTLQKYFGRHDVPALYPYSCTNDASTNGTDLYCWSTSHLDTSNELWVYCPFGSGEKVQNRFSRWPPFGISYRNNLNYFWFTSHPNASYQVSSIGLSVQEKKPKIDFRRPSWISDQKDFSYFWSTSHPDASYQFSSQLALWFRKRSKIIVSRWPPWQRFWISHWNDFSDFWSISDPNASYKV